MARKNVAQKLKTLKEDQRLMKEDRDVLLAALELKTADHQTACTSVERLKVRVAELDRQLADSRLAHKQTLMNMKGIVQNLISSVRPRSSISNTLVQRQ
jgi:CII-binding regulator of phage lambda lysogenization HflD